MKGRYRLYPAARRARRSFLAADMMLVLWSVLWVYLGVCVHAAFWSLHGLADTVLATGTGVTSEGTQIDQVVSGVQGVAAGVAFLTGVLHSALAAMLSLISVPLQTAGQTLRTLGQQLTHALESLQQDVGGVAWGLGSTLRTALDPLITLARTLTGLGASVLSAGEDLQTRVSALQHTTATLPALQEGLARAVGPLHTMPQPLGALGRGMVVQGQQELVAIGNLALLMGVLVAVAPVGVALWLYLLWRRNATRSVRCLDAILHQPGATLGTAALQVLAGRALYTLPYDHLVRYTPDPIGAWHAGRYEDLARAALDDAGLDLEHDLWRQGQEGRARLVSSQEDAMERP